MNTKQNYLENALYNMQVEYCNILKSAQKGLNTDDFMFVIDEINLFWYANRNKIKMILEIIIFTDTDKNDSLINRFKAFLNKTDIFQSNKTDAEIFMATLVGYFMQAFDIILVCLKYNLQPYLRYIIPFHNILLLAHSLPQDPEIKKILLNAKISYLLHHSVDFDIFKDLNFNEFYKKIKTTGFEDKIKNEITHKIKNNNQKDICINEYGKIIKTNLDYLFLNL